MDESRFASSTSRIRRTVVIFKLVVARVRFHSELRHQTDERLDLGQSLNFGVFDFAEVSSRSCGWLSRSHALRGNEALDAPRLERLPGARASANSEAAERRNFVPTRSVGTRRVDDPQQSTPGCTAGVASCRAARNFCITVRATYRRSGDI